LRTTRIAVNPQQVGTNSIADTEILFGDHLVTGQHGLDLASFDYGVSALHALDGTGDDMFLAIKKISQNLLTLGIANFLQDDLLGGLRADATKIYRLDRFFQGIPGLDLGIILLGLGERDFQILVDVFIIRHDLPATKGLEVTRSAINRDTDFRLVMDTFLGRRSKRKLKGAENDFLGNVLFAGQCINQQ
jgi:hypothetical protein